jgi:small subunit ribosomal protein S3e
VVLCTLFNRAKRLGLQVIVSGKLRAARAKSMKFKDGYMISSGSRVNDYIDSAVRHVMLRQVHMNVLCICLSLFLMLLMSTRLLFLYKDEIFCSGAFCSGGEVKCCVFLLQGVLGIKVKIMLDWDPKGKQGPMTPLPDVVTIHMPKEEEEFAHKPHVGKEAEM